MFSGTNPQGVGLNPSQSGQTGCLPSFKKKSFFVFLKPTQSQTAYLFQLIHYIYSLQGAGRTLYGIPKKDIPSLSFAELSAQT